MSGGSMNYLYSKIEYDAVFNTYTPERKAFRKHLVKVAAALRAIEWNDSGDGASDEEELIRACLSSGAITETLIEEANNIIAALQKEISLTRKEK